MVPVNLSKSDQYIVQKLNITFRTPPLPTFQLINLILQVCCWCKNNLIL